MEPLPCSATWPMQYSKLQVAPPYPGVHLHIPEVASHVPFADPPQSVSTKLFNQIETAQTSSELCHAPWVGQMQKGTLACKPACIGNLSLKQQNAKSKAKQRANKKRLDELNKNKKQPKPINLDNSVITQLENFSDVSKYVGYDYQLIADMVSQHYITQFSSLEEYSDDLKTNFPQKVGVFCTGRGGGISTPISSGLPQWL